MDRPFGELPPLGRAPVLIGLWSVRAVLAFFAALLGNVILAVFIESGLGIGSRETSDREYAAITLLTVITAPLIWWWLGRTRLLRSPAHSVPVSADIRVRTGAVADLACLAGKAVLFSVVTFFLMVAWLLVISSVYAVVTSHSYSMDSDRGLLAALLLAAATTWFVWRRVAQHLRPTEKTADLTPANMPGDLTTPGQLVDELAHVEDPETVPALAAYEYQPIDTPSWPGTADLVQAESPTEPRPAANAAETTVPASVASPHETPDAAASAGASVEPSERGLASGLSASVLDELNKTQRSALEVLALNDSATATDLAARLGMRVARVPGFMSGLDRQLHALGQPCFRQIRLPSGEYQYVYEAPQGQKT